MLKSRLIRLGSARPVRLGALLCLVFCATGNARAQTGSPSTMSTSTAPAGPAAAGSTGVTATETKAPAPVIATPPAQQTGSPHLIAKPGPPEDETNRKALEDNAGKDPANILMRSSPPGAQIYVNGAFVGRTPLLLTVAPGKYKIEMRGQRDDFAEQTVGLLANDTQRITLVLASRYPNRVSIP